MNLDQAVEFLHAYLEAEHREGLAARTEPDAVLAERRRESEAFMHAVPGVFLSSTLRRRPMSADELAKYATTVDQVARRTLFLVAEYAHSKWGQLFTGFASDRTAGSTGSYGLLLSVVAIEGEPKIVAFSYPDLLAMNPPTPWRYASGARINKRGRLVAVRALVEPTRADHRADWAAIRDSAP
ncbi:hypothetical protein ACFVIM_30405 [Streptomyces sp. NPDC057638]|uniref:hypothetical protein n=1 Tax=Streptomyces sp. NPDC057638 TaxID=3346190 RepID=UPI003682A78E